MHYYFFGHDTYVRKNEAIDSYFGLNELMWFARVLVNSKKT